jgi:hypothetical protein
MQIQASLFVLNALAVWAVLPQADAIAGAQDVPSAAAPAGSPEDPPAFKQEELEQMLAPIALYPDALVSQMLMASSYPTEVVQADRWVKANAALKGDAAATALEKESWDPSVKSLVNFPDVLAMMSDQLEWTQKVGDAFLGQQKQVMDTIQKLRTRAKDAGNLASDENQKVDVAQQGSSQVITIASADPRVVYVPSYEPDDAYGDWQYDDYPPYSNYNDDYYTSGAAVGLAFAWGYAWGFADWNDADIDVDVNRNSELNRSIDREKYKDKLGQAGVGTWRHDPSHRQNVPYRNKAATQRFGGTTTAQAAQAHAAFRGRSTPDAGNRPAVSKPPAPSNQPSAANRTGAGGDGSRAAQSPPKKPSGGANAKRGGGGGNGSRATQRPPPKAKRSKGALGGVNKGGQATRNNSNRGWESRGSNRGSSRGGSIRGGRGRGRR